MLRNYQRIAVNDLFYNHATNIHWHDNTWILIQIFY